MKAYGAAFCLVGLAGCGSSAALLPDGSSDRGSSPDTAVAIEASALDVSVSAPDAADGPDDLASPPDVADALDAPPDVLEVKPEAPPAERPPLQGRHAYDLVATLTAKPMDGGWPTKPLPATNRFTALVDFDQSLMLVGGGGSAQVVAIVEVAPAAFRVVLPSNANSFRVEVDGFATCSGLASVRYTAMTFFVDGATLTGTAEGAGTFISGDVASDSPFTATLGGVPDVTPPAVLGSNPASTNPLAPSPFRLSEPAVEGSKARVVAEGGGAVELVAREGTSPGARAVVGFGWPDVVLRYGESYRFDATGVTDFAGLTGAASALSFTTPPLPPLVAEDGFESLAAGTTTLGGAGVVRDGPLVPIAGAASLYVASAFFGPWSARYQQTGTFSVRLPVHAGDTKVHAAYRLVGTNAMYHAFIGTVRAGAVGGGVSGPTTMVTDGGHVTTLGPVENGTAYLGDTQSMDLGLPSGATTEVVFELGVQTSTCGPYPPVAGILLDDLRVE